MTYYVYLELEEYGPVLLWFPYVWRARQLSCYFTEALIIDASLCTTLNPT
jgi:hypothetical protein